MSKKSYKRNFSLISEYVIQQFRDRKADRNDLEKEWDEIDRQVEMRPDISFKQDSQGGIIETLKWIPELELPGQAQTLEVLTADASRLIFPDTGYWYRAVAEMTDDYLDKNDLTAIISGDKNDVPSHIDQLDINKLVEGTMAHWMRQYDFSGNMDAINAECFKYGTGIGRAREVKKRVFQNTSKGVVKRDGTIPVLFPVSIRDTYLDISKHFLMNEGQFIGPATIFYKKQKLEDLLKAAKSGLTEPTNQNGGWIPANIKGLNSDKHGEVDLLEFEGDLIVPKNGPGFIHIPNSIVTVALGSDKDKSISAVVRFRLRKKPYSTYIEFPYHTEGPNSAYATSPLLKGWPIQKSATDALIRMLAAAQLNVLPPIGYDPDSPYFVQSGGPNIYPGAQWPTIDEIRPYQIGDPGALYTIYVGLLQQYYDVTGVNAPRLGAQTVSHTTAYAKQQELSRGQTRTVDFVRNTLRGPLSQWLYNCYDIGRENFTKTSLFIEAYGGFVNIDKGYLPENVIFEAYGAGGPSEEQAKNQQRLQSLQVSLQMDQIRAQAEQLGIHTTVDIKKAIYEILRQGGWTDVDVITGTETVPTGPQGGPTLGANPQATTTAPGAALQALSEAGSL